MKVLKDNYTQSNINETIENTKPYPRKMICEHCGSELEYEESDLRIGFLGCVHLDCPLCDGENMIEENENTITLTKNNVEFPTHFYHTSKETGAVDCCNNETVKNAINQAIDYDTAEITNLANIPSRDVLISKLLGSLQSPITNFARVIKQIAEKDA